MLLRAYRDLPDGLTTRRVVASVTLLCHLAATLGLPLPAPSAGPGRDTSQPYPCMYHACGCLSAQQCWESCCCFTARERLAWAEARGIAVPDSLRAEADREANDTNQRHSHRCCSGHSHHGPDGAHCPPGCPDCAPDHDAVSMNKSALRWVSGLLASKCQGEDGSSLLHTVPATAGQPFVTWAFDWSRRETFPLTQLSAAVRTGTPDLPPPRI